MKVLSRKTKLLLGAITTYIVLWVLLFLLGFRIVLEESIEPGLYRYVSGVPSEGDFVAFYLPQKWSELALERGYLKHGFLNLRERPTIKHVAASEGDSVEVNGSGIWVNGALLDSSKAMQHDSSGRLMPLFSLRKVTLRKGEFLVVSNHKTNGLDSRYYGILNSENLISRVKPVLFF